MKILQLKPAAPSDKRSKKRGVILPITTVLATIGTWPTPAA